MMVQLSGRKGHVSLPIVTLSIDFPILLSPSQLKQPRPFLRSIVAGAGRYSQFLLFRTGKNVVKHALQVELPDGLVNERPQALAVPAHISCEANNSTNRIDSDPMPRHIIKQVLCKDPARYIAWVGKTPVQHRIYQGLSQLNCPTILICLTRAKTCK